MKNPSLHSPHTLNYPNSPSQHRRRCDIWCRNLRIYLITAWCISFIGMFIAHYGIVSLNILSEKGFFPESMFEPMTRQYCYATHVLFFVCCSSFEVVIALERITSSINPMRYYNRSFAVFPLLAITGIIISLAVLLSYWMYGEDHRSIGCAFLVILDTGTVKLNFYAVHYCNRRYEEIYGKAELSARYQVKEAHTMAVAMKPVYIASYVIKFAVNFTCIFFFFFEDAFTLLTGYIEFVYTTVVAINGGLTTGLLIRSHPRIKMRFEEAKATFLCRSSRVTPDVRRVVDSVEEGNTYFSMLEQSWR
ncbi:hypothetical protein PRIPAC_79648 [Pristionchus pacificus]|uniref:Uncharacterized protein n=1 Tax=Pristionchus pacificus TaxID=54126 RepID=A0A2A6BXM0_PRIPA|nr:hypothetical protein PRIPAC_79648 [Pristionchus pacificus]|eukprot:PDM70577.1 hypothetical protein PRIPAC_46823 [Pristionchus pacificus]